MSLQKYNINGVIYIYEVLADMNVLYDAFLKCKKNVDWKCSVQRYEANILQNLTRLRKSIIDGTYKVCNYVEFDINDANSLYIEAP